MATYQRKKGVDTDNVDIVNATETIADAAKGGVELDTDRVIKTDDLDMVQFMNQEVVILLAEPASEQEPDIVEVNVNGDYRMGIRGNEMRVKRSHLAVMARAKQSRVRQRKTVDRDGSMSFSEETVLQLTYPFQVVEDPDPRRGAPWLRQLLSNPG